MSFFVSTPPTYQYQTTIPVREASIALPVKQTPDQFVASNNKSAILPGTASLEQGTANVLRTINPTGPGISSNPSRIIPPHWQKFPTGSYNAITDVPGIEVGHVRLNRDWPSTIRTGVTAIVPNAGKLTEGLQPARSSPANLANTGYRAAAVTLNGNGEMTGMGPLTTSGLLNSPIILTNTASVGVAHEGVVRYFNERFPNQWPGQLPVVGECLDAYFSNTDEPALKPSDTISAISAARGGPVSQGRTGAGTGMRSFEMHAGIGSSSRQITIDGKTYTIGVLVNANHSKLDTMNPLLYGALQRHWGASPELVSQQDNLDKAVKKDRVSPRQGSIITVIATDLPLDSKALHQLAERAGMGIANTGSYMATTSGDFALAFSTANPIPLGKERPQILSATSVHPDSLSPILQATVEAVTEAQLNAIVSAHSR